MAVNLVNVENVSKVYGTRALLDGVSLDGFPEMPAPLRLWLRDKSGVLIRNASEIAQRLLDARNPEERAALYDTLAECWADRCWAAGMNSDPAVAAAVATLRAEVVPSSEYGSDRMMRSEQLDLDHMSPPTPL